MAHKGYTLNYFIEYFSSIPDHQWCVGEEHKEGTVQHCALGHAQRNARTTLERTNKRANQRMEALNSFLNDETADINDNSSRYSDLGKTPRGRILKALRNRQKYGHFLGKDAAEEERAAANEDAYLSDYGYDEYY
jgi:hypothetical protein